MTRICMNVIECWSHCPKANNKLSPFIEVLVQISSPEVCVEQSRIIWNLAIVIATFIVLLDLSLKRFE